MTFASDMQAVAAELLATVEDGGFGQQLTFTRIVAGDFVPATGVVNGNVTSTYTALCHPSQYNAEEIDGTLIKRDDVKLIAYTATTPFVGDTVSLDSVSHRLQNVQRLKAQGTDIIYILQARI